MTPERRTAARGQAVAKVKLTDAAADKMLEGELHDVGRGGLFVASKTQLPVGKMVDVEIVTSTGAIAGMGRVIWIRDSQQGDLPAGMGIKFIDADNEALLAIDRLVGLKKNVRERTVLGMMAPTTKDAPKIEPSKIVAPKPEPAKVEAPKVEAHKPEPPRPIAKPRERTMLGIAPPVAREKELSWPDMPPDPPPEPEPPPAAKDPEPSPPPSPPKDLEPAPVLALEPELESVKREESIPIELVKEPVVAIEEPLPIPDASPVDAGPPAPRELPKREEGGGALKWIVLLVVIVAVGAGVYLLRDKIFPRPIAPTPSATVSASASASAAPMPSASASETASAMPSASAAIPETDVDAATDTVASDAGADANLHDAGHDAGDGGHHHHDGGVLHHLHAPHPPAGGTADNPY